METIKEEKDKEMEEDRDEKRKNGIPTFMLVPILMLVMFSFHSSARCMHR